MLVSIRYSVLSLVLILVFSISACKRDDLSPEYQENLNSFAGVATFNAIEGSRNINFQIDQKTLNQDNESFSIGGYLSHMTVFPGERNVQLTHDTNAAVFFGKIFNFEASNLYSIFFYGKSDQNKDVKYILTKDSLFATNQGKIKLRIANLVSDNELSISFKDSKDVLNIKNQVTSFKERNHQQLILEVSGDKTANIQYETVAVNFSPVNRGVYTLVFYAEINSVSGVKELKYNIIKH